ncbi:FlgO family outer membrane protein [Aliarcobacter butzleri]|uniref:FlgO family outer membrane protein n=1 Tax=Aliarcobacter butzleri TaxID=28197 RepID=UPI002B2445B3|nr:FlgO family outer membrane protein [Aliarcobacter butzleri]
MTFKMLRVLKLFLVSILLSTIFISCSYKNPVTRITDFHSMISDMVDKSAIKIKRNILLGEVVLVSDFVNLDKLKNKSQLGFLLSNILKDKLSSLNIIVREIELGKEFEFGSSGFNLLTREKDKILSDKVKSKYAVVGTYSISNKSLNVFIKLIDINTGNILSSSFARTDIDDEIVNLEGNYSIEEKDKPKEPIIRQPLVL